MFMFHPPFLFRVLFPFCSFHHMCIPNCRFTNSSEISSIEWEETSVGEMLSNKCSHGLLVLKDFKLMITHNLPCIIGLGITSTCKPDSVLNLEGERPMICRIILFIIVHLGHIQNGLKQVLTLIGYEHLCK